MGGLALARQKIQLGNNVDVARHVRVRGDVIIEDGCIIEDFCVLGHSASAGPLRIGAGSLVRSHTVIYSGSTLGPGLETGHHVLIREGTQAGKNLRIGSYSSIEGNCTIGDYCRFHGYVQVGQGSKIGNFVWLFSLSILLNDPLPPSDIFEPPILEDGVVVCTGGRVMPGATLKKGSFVATGGVALGEVPEDAVVGQEGKIIAHVSHLAHLERGVIHPWMNHYDKKHYPEEAWKEIEKSFERKSRSAG